MEPHIDAVAYVGGDLFSGATLGINDRHRGQRVLLTHDVVVQPIDDYRGDIAGNTPRQGNHLVTSGTEPLFDRAETIIDGDAYDLWHPRGPVCTVERLPIPETKGRVPVDEW